MSSFQKTHRVSHASDRPPITQQLSYIKGTVCSRLEAPSPCRSGTNTQQLKDKDRSYRFYIGIPAQKHRWLVSAPVEIGHDGLTSCRFSAVLRAGNSCRSTKGDGVWMTFNATCSEEFRTFQGRTGISDRVLRKCFSSSTINLSCCSTVLHTGTPWGPGGAGIRSQPHMC